MDLGRPTKNIRVLRIGHRYVRDYRTLTHLCLVSRAFGAEAIYLEEIDDGLMEGVQEVNETWGGGFEVRQVPSWKSAIKRGEEGGKDGDAPDHVRHAAPGQDRRSWRSTTSS